MTTSRPLTSHLLAALCGTLVFLPWIAPGSISAAALGWVGAGAIAHLLHSGQQLRTLYTCGLVVYALGFSFLLHTISFFGGFPLVAALPIFLLFVTVSAAQLPIAGWLFRRLPAALDRLALRVPLAWAATEVVPIRIFPWMFGHTQLGFSWLAQIADLGGVICISVALLWCADAIVQALWFRNRRALVPAGIALAAALAYGAARIPMIESLDGAAQQLALIQANISIEEKHDVALIEQNAARYKELSKEIAKPDQLLIWPESVLQDWTYAKIGHANADPRLPFFPGSNLLTGALTYESRTRVFNSALAVFSDGQVPEPSHKQILMPFGEYTPLGDVIPFLRQINATAGDFTPGERIKVFEFPRSDGTTARTSALICYEDMIPAPARRAVQDGAEFLVNLTNDAWFGDTLAPRAHNAMAAFRAIENRRFLARSTNTGITSLISPTGKVLETLPAFSEGTLLATVKLLGYKSLYTRVVGESAGWGILVITLVLAALGGRRTSRG